MSAIMSSATLPALVGTIKNSGHAKQLRERFPPLLTLKESTGITNLSVGLLVSVEMYVQGITSFSAPARQTVIEMARVALALEFALDQHRSFLVPSRVSTIVLSISACSQTSIPSNLCAMTSVMLSTAFRIPFVPKFVLLSIAHLQRLARRRSRRQPTNLHALRHHVWMMWSSVLWIVGMSRRVFFLEPLQMGHPFSRSRSVTRAHVQDHSDSVTLIQARTTETGINNLWLSLRKSPQDNNHCTCCEDVGSENRLLHCKE